MSFNLLSPSLSLSLSLSLPLSSLSFSFLPLFLLFFFLSKYLDPEPYWFFKYIFIRSRIPLKFKTRSGKNIFYGWKHTNVPSFLSFGSGLRLNGSGSLEVNLDPDPTLRITESVLFLWKIRFRIRALAKPDLYPTLRILIYITLW